MQALRCVCRFFVVFVSVFLTFFCVFVPSFYWTPYVSFSRAAPLALTLSHGLPLLLALVRACACFLWVSLSVSQVY